MKCKPHLHKLLAGPIDGHVYIVMVDGTRHSISAALRTIGRWASNDEVPLTWRDAAYISDTLLNPPFTVN
jgi:hypothetical protein